MKADMATELAEADIFHHHHRLPPDVPRIEPYVEGPWLTSGEMKAVLFTLAGAGVALVSWLFYYTS